MNAVEMKAIERAVCKLRSMQHRAPEIDTHVLTQSEIQSLICAGELLVNMARAVEAGASVEIGDDDT